MPWQTGDIVGPTNLNLRGASASSTTGFSTNTLNPESGNTIIVQPYGTAFVSQSRDSGGQVFDVKVFGAVGNGTADDTAAIQSATSAAIQVAGTVFFPVGVYSVSTWINLGPRVTWCGAGYGSALTTGSKIIATGVNTGIIKWRPGSIGGSAPISGQDSLKLYNLWLSGNTSGTSLSGHLVDLARVTNCHFDHVTFSQSQGTGFKDDGVSAVSAAAIHAMACERITITDCLVWNNLVGIMPEANTHTWYVAHNSFNSNIRADVLFTTNDNGQMCFIANHHDNSGCVYRSDTGDMYGFTAIGNWYEKTSETTYSVFSMAGGPRNRSFFVAGNNFAGGGIVSNQNAISIANLDSGVFVGNRFSTWSQVFNITSGTTPSNVLGPNDYVTVTTVIASATSTGGSQDVRTSDGTILFFPSYYSGRIGIGTPTPTAARITQQYNAPTTYANNLSDFAYMWQDAQGNNALGLSLQTNPATAYWATNGGYDIGFAFSGTEKGRFRAATGILAISPGGIQVADGTTLAPSSAFSSEASLGWFKSAASTTALSYGTLNMNQAYLASVKTATSVSSANLGINAIAIANPGVSGASLCFNVNGVMYFINSSGTTIGR